MTKRVQIPRELYDTMVSYIDDHFDIHDKSRFDYIKNGVIEKQKAEYKHALYSFYKSNAPEEDRLIAKSMYLDEVGVPESFRWSGFDEIEF